MGAGTAGGHNWRGKAAQPAQRGGTAGSGAAQPAQRAAQTAQRAAQSAQRAAQPAQKGGTAGTAGRHRRHSGAAQAAQAAQRQGGRMEGVNYILMVFMRGVWIY